MLNLQKCKMYSRKIGVFKCQYAHFAHIHSPFGCTDEKMDLSIYLDTYSRNFQNFPNSKIWKLKCCNMSGSIFRISKNPDMGKMGIGTKSRFSVYFPINSRSTTEWPVCYPHGGNSRCHGGNASVLAHLSKGSPTCIRQSLPWCLRLSTSLHTSTRLLHLCS